MLPDVPLDQRSTKGSAASRKRKGSPQPTAPTATSIPERNGDRSSGDDDQRVLPVFVRFPDLKAAGIVGSWQQLLRMIDHEGFPAGVMLSPNVRAWQRDEVEAWLASRPTARKVPPPARKPSGRKRKEQAA